MDTIRRDSSYRAETSAAKLVAETAEAVERDEGIELARQELITRGGPVNPGGRVRLRGGRIEGIVISHEGETAWLDIGGKRMRIALADLEPVASPRRVTRDSRRDARHLKESRVSSLESSASTLLTREVNVIGRRLDEAISEVEQRLDQAVLEGTGRLRVVHGHGTGRLREGIREHFRSYPGVARLYPADAREGGNGATIVELE